MKRWKDKLSSQLTRTFGMIEPLDAHCMLAVTICDFDQDGQRDAADIVPMMAVLADPSTYKTAQNNLSDASLLAIGDLNQDGKFTNADLQALMDLLKGDHGTDAAVVLSNRSETPGQIAAVLTNTFGDTANNVAIAPSLNSTTDQITGSLKNVFAQTDTRVACVLTSLGDSVDAVASSLKHEFNDADGQVVNVPAAFIVA